MDHLERHKQVHPLSVADRCYLAVAVQSQSVGLQSIRGSQRHNFESEGAHKLAGFVRSLVVECYCSKVEEDRRTELVHGQEESAQLTNQSLGMGSGLHDDVDEH